jgi:hypothetical protein
MNDLAKQFKSVSVIQNEVTRFLTLTGTAPSGILRATSISDKYAPILDASESVGRAQLRFWDNDVRTSIYAIAYIHCIRRYQVLQKKFSWLWAAQRSYGGPFSDAIEI